MTTTTAAQIVRGDEVTDYMGHKFTVRRVEHNIADGRGVYLWPEDQGYPEFYLNDGAITLHNVPARAAGVVLDDLTRRYIAESQARLNRITANRNLDDGQWRYLSYRDLQGHMDRREYRTERGFLTAYIRVARQGCDILIAE